MYACMPQAQELMMTAMAQQQQDFMQSLLDSDSDDDSEDDTTDDDSSASSHCTGDAKAAIASVGTQVAGASAPLKDERSVKARLPDCILCQEVCIQ